MLESIRTRTYRKLSDRFAPIKDSSTDETDVTVLVSTSAGFAPSRALQWNGCDLRVIVPETLKCGDHVEVMLHDEDPVRDAGIPGIVHFAELRKSGMEVGIALKRPIRIDVPNSDPFCRRESIRYQCRVPGEIRWRDTMERVDVLAVNYSGGGVAFRSRSAPGMGREFSFSWTDATGFAVVDGVVCWVIDQTGNSLFGCEVKPGSGYRLSGIRV